MIVYNASIQEGKKKKEARHFILKYKLSARLLPLEYFHLFGSGSRVKVLFRPRTLSRTTISLGPRTWSEREGSNHALGSMEPQRREYRPTNSSLCSTNSRLKTRPLGLRDLNAVGSIATVVSRQFSQPTNSDNELETQNTPFQGLRDLNAVGSIAVNSKVLV